MKKIYSFFLLSFCAMPTSQAYDLEQLKSANRLLFSGTSGVDGYTRDFSALLKEWDKYRQHIEKAGWVKGDPFFDAFFRFNMNPNGDGTFGNRKEIESIISDICSKKALNPVDCVKGITNAAHALCKFAPLRHQDACFELMSEIHHHASSLVKQRDLEPQTQGWLTRAKTIGQSFFDKGKWWLSEAKNIGQSWLTTQKDHTEDHTPREMEEQIKIQKALEQSYEDPKNETEAQREEKAQKRKYLMEVTLPLSDAESAIRHIFNGNPEQYEEGLLQRWRNYAYDEHTIRRQLGMLTPLEEIFDAFHRCTHKNNAKDERGIDRSMILKNVVHICNQSSNPNLCFKSFVNATNELNDTKYFNKYFNRNNACFNIMAEIDRDLHLLLAMGPQSLQKLETLYKFKKQELQKKLAQQP